MRTLLSIHSDCTVIIIQKEFNNGNESSEVVAVVELLLDGEQPGGVPRVEAGDLVVLLNLLREPVQVLLLAFLDEGLQQFGMSISKWLSAEVPAIEHESRIIGHCNSPALLVSHFQASI